MGLPFDAEQIAAVEQSLANGLAAFAVPAPISLPRWADENFYLSAESSYVEQRWKPWSFQPAILACMGFDDIEEVDVKKSARVGYTKMLLAHTAYKLHHKRRNVAIWQPTDEDRDEFVKTEFEPMLRDVICMRDVFPENLAKNKANTLKQKMMLGCTVHLRGGKAAKNYRRISVDDAVLDEISGFDQNIEKEGSAWALARKRIEGASFPKMICGSTPKEQHSCQISKRVEEAQYVFRRHVPCPTCGHMHPLEWGDQDTPHGMKWTQMADIDATSETIKQLCPNPECHVLYTQAEFVTIEAQGEWRTDAGVRLVVDADGYPEFYAPTGERLPTPRHVAFDDLWSAYSPAVQWSGILRDYLNAMVKAKRGDTADLQTWTNTTRGATWELRGEKTEGGKLAARAEPYGLRTIPMGGLILAASVDVQDRWFEIVVKARGRDSEDWVVDHVKLDANPADERDWAKLDAYLLSTFTHASGMQFKLEAVAIDTGGHFTHQVYNFCRVRENRRVFAVRGANRYGLPVKGRPRYQDVNWNGRVIKRGVKLYEIGTDTAKDLIHGRLQITRPGGGFQHFSSELTEEFYEQLTAEQRLLQKTAQGEQSRWVKIRARNEVLDCFVMIEFAFAMLNVDTYTDAMWRRLEDAVRTADLFAAPPPPAPQPQAAAPTAPPAVQTPAPAAVPVRPAPSNPALGTSDWSSRL
ncbi:MAG: phage terminase large subunit family protein [Candidatus Dactylopiibacterium sp.]|nr:phage terminase large subunit family protein [Candidatus Dactylopiibacterium sp.]